MPFVGQTAGEAGVVAGRRGEAKDGPLRGFQLVTNYGWRRGQEEATRSGDDRLGTMNEERQRVAVLEFRCQVCATQLPPEGPWWHVAGPVPLNDQVPFREPAVCEPCLGYALRVCPGLVGGHRRTGDVTVYRVTKRRVAAEIITPEGLVIVQYPEALAALAAAGIPFAVTYAIAVATEWASQTRDEWLEGR